MLNKKAYLFKSQNKMDIPLETVTVLYIAKVKNEDMSYIAASVERENGDVIEVPHDRLQFITKEEG